LAVTTLVFKTPRNECSSSHLATSEPKSINKPKVRETPFCRKQLLKTSGIDSFRENLAAEGISGKAACLITKSKRKEQMLITNRPGETSLVGFLFAISAYHDHIP